MTSPEALIELGASELGGISEKTRDYINPESPWPKEEELKRINAPYVLRTKSKGDMHQNIYKGWIHVIKLK